MYLDQRTSKTVLRMYVMEQFWLIGLPIFMQSDGLHVLTLLQGDGLHSSISMQSDELHVLTLLQGDGLHSSNFDAVRRFTRFNFLQRDGLYSSILIQSDGV